MMIIVTTSGTYGPFQTVETLADRWRADGQDLQFSVVGTGTIESADNYDADVSTEAAAARINVVAQLEAMRIQKQNKGLAYTFPDGQGVVQTRNGLQDLVNINGAVTSAMLYLQQGLNTSTSFTDGANVPHAMSPAQMIAMGSAVGQFISSLYDAKRAHVSAINALTTADAIYAHDTTAGWPN